MTTDRDSRDSRDSQAGLDSLDRLVREAAGPLPDPTVARRAIRASLAAPLARRERRQARQGVGAVVALSLLLVVGLAGPLGSDDFEVTVSKVTRNGRELTRYEQGLQRHDILVTPRAEELGMDRQAVEDLMMAKDTHEAVPVRLNGWRLGTVEYVTVAAEYSLEHGGVGSVTLKGPKIPRVFRDWIRAGGLSPGEAMEQLVLISQSRAPDFTSTMIHHKLLWTIDGWRVTLPGHEPIIYFEGLRADGVRPIPED